MSKVRLSQCMIVKDEERNIRRALSWGKGIVSEQIVVDTGSVDRTAEIAEEMGAKVYHFDWMDDFSAAKNYAIEQATGDWILFLDADEYMLEGSAEQVQNLADLISEKYKNKPCTIQCLKVELDSKGQEYCTDLCERIFTKFDIHYVGTIHEILISDDGRAINIYNAQDEFKIYHTGYSSQEFTEKKKLDRNRKLLSEKLEKNPDNPIALMYMGDNYEAEGRWEEADACYKKSIGLIPHTEENQSVLSHDYAERLHILDKLGKKEEFILVYEAAVAYDPGYPDFYFYRGFFEYDQGNHTEAIQYLEQSIEVAKKYRGIAPTVTYARLHKLFQFLTQLASECRDRERVVQYGIFSLQKDKYDEQILQIFINELSSGVNDDGNGLFSILSQIYDLHIAKDRLLLLKCVKQAGHKALEQIIFEALTKEII